MPVEVFGGSATQVAYPSVSFLDITANSITLVWPTSYFNVPSVVGGIHYDVLAASIYVTDGGGNTHTITLPDATQTSNGASFIITNIGASSFNLLKSDGSLLVVIPNSPSTSNSFWIQLTDNSTSVGQWRILQFGAGTSQAIAASLAGNGLVAISNLLNTNIAVTSIVASPYNVLVSDRAKLLIWDTGTGAINLPNIADVPAGYYVSINNEGTGIVTVSGDRLIDRHSSIDISIGQSLSIISDGSVWWTLGFGQTLSAANFASGSALAPSITFTADTTTGIYYYQTAFPPVTPPGIGFSVSSAPIANFSSSGLYMNSGKNLVIQDSTNIAQTIVSANASYGELSWTDTGLSVPASLRVSGTNTETTLTLAPFNRFNISESNTSAIISYNGNNIISINPAGVATFSFTVNMNVPLAIASGGTGQNNQQDALNALMPATPVIGDLLYFDGTNWVRLPVGAHTAGAVMTLVGSPPIPTWVP